MKHIGIDIHFVRDMVTRGQVHVFHMPSRYDIFAKGLPAVLFEKFRTSLSVRSPLASTARECWSTCYLPFYLVGFVGLIGLFHHLCIQNNLVYT